MSSNTPFEDELASLDHFLAHHPDIDSSLQELTKQIASLLMVERCSIMFVKPAQHDANILRMRVKAHTGNLSPEATKSDQSRTGISESVLKSGKPLLVRDIQESDFAHLAKRAGGFICVPIWMNNTPSGVVNISEPRDGRTFSEHDLELALVLSRYLAKSIQLLRAEGILNSRFAMMMLEKSQSPNEPAANFAGDPHKVAIILARGFFNELKSLGIGDDHILEAGNELIGLTIKDMNDQSKRTG
jgi:L-methionine (R)-S-oxide reductase